MSERGKETNIQVVVRVRPRNKQEIAENSAITIYASNDNINVKTACEYSSKTYTFDKVFGPDSTQQNVFSEVVEDMLQEVTAGYNCTIFAYGQTAAGKTYTMEGDLTNIQGEKAGVIPRTLYQLFSFLEKSDVEYSFRVSFIELYNEELKDLLSLDKDENKKLRIFEDNARKGSVVIQGIEEVLVKNAQDVIHILQRGSNKRQVGSTKMNETSSRSHSIFSITVHIKETTPDGEELLKVGKLNLVDLAGSENIGRSGAENKRAKEAGMINQSLLTLGRVINALVDRSPHVPYRESKLTRLLQDSLGGKTKTCIIAAVSPAKCNLEETLSTLEYAHRAKNIRNKPEVNQKMTKRALIREYINEIEKLKADLTATREKNGVYMNSDTYHSLMADFSGKGERIEEIEKSIKAKTEIISDLEAKFQQNVELLNSTNTALDSALVELKGKKEELNEATNMLVELKNQLVEQKMLTNVYSTNEKRLHTLASGLVTNLTSSVEDIDGLLHKIDRKESIEAKNVELFNTFRGILKRQLCEVNTEVEEFASLTSHYKTDFDERIKSFLNGQETKLKSEHVLLDQNLDNLLQLSSALSSKNTEYEQYLHHQVNSLTENTHQLINIIQDCKKTSSNLYGNFKIGLSELFDDSTSDYESWNKKINSAVEGLLEAFTNNLIAQEKHDVELREGVIGELNSEIARLSTRNASLESQLSTQKEQFKIKSEKMQAGVLEMFKKLEHEYDEDMNNIWEKSKENMAISVKSIDKIKNDVDKIRQAISDGNVDFYREEVVIGVEGIKNEIDIGLKSYGESLEQIQQFCEESQQKVDQNWSFAKKEVELVVETINQVASSIDNSKSAFAQETQSSLDLLGNSCKADTLNTKKRNLDFWELTTNKFNEFDKKAKDLHMSTNTFLSSSTRNLATAMKTIEIQTFDQDEQTGATPRKKIIAIPNTISMTANEDYILKKFRIEQENELPDDHYLSYSYIDTKPDVKLFKLSDNDITRSDSKLFDGNVLDDYGEKEKAEKVKKNVLAAQCFSRLPTLASSTNVKAPKIND